MIELVASDKFVHHDGRDVRSILKDYCVATTLYGYGTDLALTLCWRLGSKGTYTGMAKLIKTAEISRRSNVAL